jgi:HSP20 family protein
MAEAKTNRPETSRPTIGSQRDPQQPGALQRRQQQAAWASNPFEMMDRLAEEMFGRMFGDFMGPRRSWLGRNQFRSMQGQSQQGQGLWAPRVEAFQKGDRFIIHAELPGLKKDDVQVEVTDDQVIIQGERREKQQEEREGYYHSEVDYGQFYRQIPLPEGVIADNAQANFRDGVLEISMPAPPSEANRGRRLEIKEASTDGADKK